MDHRERRRHGPALPGLLVACVLAGLVLLRDPGASGDRLRELFGTQERRAEVVALPAGAGEYEFAATQPGSEEPVSWNPCRDIEYVVNPAGAPAHWPQLVERSIATLSEATGFRFVYGGETDDRNFTSRIGALGRSAPVLIGWADAEEVEELAGDVAGVGGAAYLESTGRWTYTTGMVVLDTDVFVDLPPGSDPRELDLQAAILDHELGHVVGLGHVDSREELMYADNVGRTSFGTGDLQGLALLGAAPCS
ncbi:matrixin family metalloprotease [Nocardioides sp. zg-579]|uniref:Matrixin family metalloprotease n=1 Tax=Nocardioides marmotae TaxID=2663857 RepID=A0A6I3J9G2_9ACTN|nr:matrixin family metalloprotease [Nocardioides marmotae]MCR6030403.1 matrixin family metalloprotease [Gordonia jinghuaiqii]MTB94038.1 matrixin family metalloprotease [Nocardioides marmotae]QKE00347.1 matrixin family metalloprotease [Nocardioides marmotae]